MAAPVRIKRRWTGAAGAPASLLSGELAYNGLDNTLYLGFGDDGAGNATSIKAVAGLGIMVALSGDQTIAGVKTFSSSPLVPTLGTADSSAAAASTAFVKAAIAAAGPGGGSLTDGDKGDITVSGTGTTWVIDNGAVTLPKMANLAANSLIGNNTASTAAPAALSATNVKTLLALNNVDNTSDANKPVSNATQTALNAKAPLASPTFTGVPAAPTATAGTNTTQLATTAFVAAAVAALINGSPGALDTLQELAAAMGDDPNFATTVTNSIAGKLAIASNLSDLADKPTARTNLGLGSMAMQAASAVAITGGTIDGVTIDGGTF